MATISTILAFYFVVKVASAAWNKSRFSFKLNRTIQRASLCIGVALVQLTAF